MTPKIASMKKYFVTQKGQKSFWQPETDPFLLARKFHENGVPDTERAAARLCYVLDNEKPLVFPDERIAFTRTVRTIPEIFTAEEEAGLRKRFHLHEKGDVCNINVDYARLLRTGFAGMRSRISDLIRQSSDQAKKAYWGCQTRILDSLAGLMERYAAEADRVGNATVRDTVSRLAGHAPETLLEAMQMFRIIHFAMWAGRNYHNTIGRIDQYMYPYYRHDIDKGVLDRASALELTEEFFLSFNRDSDLYPGMQQGDNGQSLVLGGHDANGNDLYNEFSEICINASLDLRLIDPKINLRVDSSTSIERYVLGTKMTKQGLGFPQYSSDDIVVKGLEKLGYAREDALDYVVAACWEFIIPGKAMDIPNLDALSFLAAVRKATVEDLVGCPSFEAFMAAVGKRIKESADSIIGGLKPVYIYPAPFLSLMMEGCVENARDVSLGCKYNNYGLHGTGVAPAVDSLANIKKFVFDDQRITAVQMVEAIESDFADDPVLGNQLRYSPEKFGNDTPLTNRLAAELLRDFAEALKGRRNDRGGIFRPGTGSAMYYIWHSEHLGATPDGRKKGEMIPANYSPSLFAKIKGPVSVVKSYAFPNLEDVINGGPLTIELHDSIFRIPDNLEKVAMLIKSYFDLGGHQLQINTVNRDALLDAQKHPEDHRNLIVRVWGWSGYFVELDKCYQDHIIKRMEMNV